MYPYATNYGAPPHGYPQYPGMMAAPGGYPPPGGGVVQQQQVTYVFQHPAAAAPTSPHAAAPTGFSYPGGQPPPSGTSAFAALSSLHSSASDPSVPPASPHTQFAMPSRPAPTPGDVAAGHWPGNPYAPAAPGQMLSPSPVSGLEASRYTYASASSPAVFPAASQFQPSQPQPQPVSPYPSPTAFPLASTTAFPSTPSTPTPFSSPPASSSPYASASPVFPSSVTAPPASYPPLSPSQTTPAAPFAPSTPTPVFPSPPSTSASQSPFFPSPPSSSSSSASASQSPFFPSTSSPQFPAVPSTSTSTPTSPSPFYAPPASPLSLSSPVTSPSQQSPSLFPSSPPSSASSSPSAVPISHTSPAAYQYLTPAPAASATPLSLSAPLPSTSVSPSSSSTVTPSRPLPTQPGPGRPLPQPAGPARPQPTPPAHPAAGRPQPTPPSSSSSISTMPAVSAGPSRLSVRPPGVQVSPAAPISRVETPPQPQSQPLSFDVHIPSRTSLPVSPSPSPPPRSPSPNARPTSPNTRTPSPSPSPSPPLPSSSARAPSPSGRPQPTPPVGAGPAATAGAHVPPPRFSQQLPRPPQTAGGPVPVLPVRPGRSPTLESPSSSSSSSPTRPAPHPEYRRTMQPTQQPPIIRPMPPARTSVRLPGSPILEQQQQQQPPRGDYAPQRPLTSHSEPSISPYHPPQHSSSHSSSSHSSSQSLTPPLRSSSSFSDNNSALNIYSLAFKVEPFGTMSEKSPTGLRVVHFIAYRIVVVNTSDDTQSYYLVKRFSQLWDLKHVVKKALPKVQYATLHQFPPKKWHQGDTPAVIQERCDHITLWLNSLNRVTQIFQLPAFQHFLSRSGVDDANSEPPVRMGTPSQSERRAMSSLSTSEQYVVPPAAMRPFAVVLNVVRATDLRCIRGSQGSNPYCIVYAIKNINTASPLTTADDFLLARTPIHNTTVHPIWNFPVFLPSLEIRHAAGSSAVVPLVFLIEVWDHGVEDSFLGQAYVNAAKLGDCQQPVEQLELELIARPPKPMPGGRPPRVDTVSGSITVSMSFGEAIQVAPKTSKTRKGMAEKMKAHRAKASFCAYMTPASYFAQGGFDSIFQAPNDPNVIAITPTSSASEPYLFSLKITFHCALNLKEEKDPNPYLHLYLVAAGSSDRTLIFRTTVVKNSLNPTWESSMVSPSVRSTDILEWEIRSWGLGVSSSDTLFGRGAMTFPVRGPIAAQSRINVPLQLTSERRAGSLCLSYQTDHAVLDRSEVVHDLFPGDEEAENYRAIPNYPSHCINYGVSIPNFRDIGGWPVSFYRNGSLVRGRMRHGLVFRTSGISRATDNDARLIIESLGIKSLIDLRTPDYAGNRGPFLSTHFDVLQMQVNKKDAKDMTVYAESAQEITLYARDAQDTIIVSHAQQRASTPSSVGDSALAALDTIAFDFVAESLRSAKSKTDWGHLYLCSLVGKQFQFAMIKKSGKGRLLTAGLLAKTPQEQRRLICGPIFDRSDGLVVLYRIMVENSKLEFLQLFTLFDQIAEYPVAFFCNHGKDRTGMTAMFLQTICGVDRETIVDNYRLSDHFLRPLKYIVDYEMTDGGLSPEIMSRTPGFVMTATLDYLDRKYNGPLNYLLHIGVPQAALDRIRDKLVEV